MVNLCDFDEGAQSGIADGFFHLHGDLHQILHAADGLLPILVEFLCLLRADFHEFFDCGGFFLNRTDKSAPAERRKKYARKEP